MGSIFSNEICCYKNKESTEIEICSETDPKKVKANSRQKSSILIDKCSKNKESSERFEYSKSKVNTIKFSLKGKLSKCIFMIP